MMRASTLPLIFGVLASSTVALSAAPAPTTAQLHVSRQTIAEFARCVVNRHHREASDYVLRKIPQAWQLNSSAERRLADRDCIPTASTRDGAQALLKMHRDEQLRPAFAEALVRQDLSTFNASLITTAQPLDYGKLVDSLWPPDACKKCKGEQLNEFEHARARSSALMAPLILGECVVRTDPMNAHRLLMADAVTAGETSVLNALQSALNNCAAEGLQFNTTRTAIRESLALNYYRLARAPRVQSAVGAPK